MATFPFLAYDSLSDEKWAEAFGYEYKGKNNKYYKSKKESPDYDMIDMLKEIYSSEKFKDLVYNSNPLIAKIPK